MKSKIAVVFLDRDGTIIEDLHYPKEADKVTLLPYAVEGLKLMQKKGYLLFVVSNQSGVGRGIIKDNEFREVHEKFCELLKNAGVKLDGVAYCLHHPEDLCQCRKPEIGLVPQKLNNRPISFEDSYTVGDKFSDLELADHIGSRGCLVLSGKGHETLAELNNAKSLSKYQVFKDLLEMAKSLPDRV